MAESTIHEENIELQDLAMPDIQVLEPQDLSFEEFWTYSGGKSRIFDFYIIKETKEN